ncbi:MAG: hypothetical protein CL570_03585 [Alphaproteobacteria bacterium]|nr:hypothetical protein [Alphaproteobacteria bacterium]|tara:strand:+ start:11934 stop:12134 length:201 start_codon:yes stop_codon:yes gene_type:complete
MKKLLLITVLTTAIGGGAILTTANAKDSSKPAVPSAEQKMVTQHIHGMHCPKSFHTHTSPYGKLIS